MGSSLHLGIGGTQTTHADIFPHRVIKQVVILRDIGHLLVELRERNGSQIAASHGDAALFDIPEARCQLGNGGLATAGGPDQCGHLPGRSVQADVVQDHLVIMITERNMLQRNIMVCKRYRCSAVFLLLGGQDGIHLSDSSTHHGQRICVVYPYTEKGQRLF